MLPHRLQNSGIRSGRRNHKQTSGLAGSGVAEVTWQVTEEFSGARLLQLLAELSTPCLWYCLSHCTTKRTLPSLVPACGVKRTENEVCYTRTSPATSNCADLRQHHNSCDTAEPNSCSEQRSTCKPPKLPVGRQLIVPAWVAKE